MKKYRVWLSDGNDRQEMTHSIFGETDEEKYLLAADLETAREMMAQGYLTEEGRKIMEDDPDGNGDSIYVNECIPTQHPYCEAEGEYPDCCEDCEGNYFYLTLEEVTE